MLNFLKTTLKVLGVVIGGLIVFIAGFAGYGLYNLYQTQDGLFLRDRPAETSMERIQNIDDADPIAILLAGTDSGGIYDDVEDHEGRTDVLMVMTLNPNTDKMKLISIPRDTVVPLEEIEDGSFRFGKINGSQSVTDEFGQLRGMDHTLKVVSNYLNTPIDYYASINLDGFVDGVDALGGIELTPTMTFNYNGSEFVEGQRMKLTGKEALDYVRMRKYDPEGDIGRQKRQQDVIDAAINKATNLGTLVINHSKILNVVEDNIRTNIYQSEINKLITGYLSTLRNREKLTVGNYKDLNTDFGYYLFIPEAQRLEISDVLQSELELDNEDNAIVYPVEYHPAINDPYFQTVDYNGDGLITNQDMVIKPGFYTLDELDTIIREVNNNHLIDFTENSPYYDELYGEDTNSRNYADETSPIESSITEDALQKNIGH